MTFLPCRLSGKVGVENRGTEWREWWECRKFDWWKFSEWEFSWYWRKFMRRILKSTCIDIDLHQKNLHSLDSIASVFIPTPIITFSYGVEIFPHPLVQLIGHVSALIGYGMEIHRAFLESTWKTKVRVQKYFCNGLYSRKLILIRYKSIAEVKAKVKALKVI